MTRTCLDCSATISAKSTGRCTACSNRSPERRAKAGKGWRRRTADWCPSDQQRRYHSLRAYHGAEEAKQLIVTEIGVKRDARIAFEYFDAESRTRALDPLESLYLEAAISVLDSGRVGSGLLKEIARAGGKRPFRAAPVHPSAAISAWPRDDWLQQRDTAAISQKSDDFSLAGRSARGGQDRPGAGDDCINSAMSPLDQMLLRVLAGARVVTKPAMPSRVHDFTLGGVSAGML